MSAINPKTWQSIEALFHDALEQPEAQRDDWLSRQCGDDRLLREQVATLLRSARRANDTLERGVQVQAPRRPATRSLQAGDRIDRYRILEVVGQGGMGIVYRAQRDDGQVRQQVALKLLKPEARDHLHRFETERQLLAGLDHPGIARLIDGGLTADGQPFMAMEFVEGLPLLAHCKARDLGLSARLDLFDQVCAAVGHAHRNLIVHRDLKSGNILVTAEGRVKLLDFGIAKLLPAEGWNTEDEATRNAPLTPDHAAPEQLLGQRVTTATDVYALGVVLYRLLGQRSPWADLQSLPVTRAIQAVLNTEAPPLSRAAEAEGVAHARALRGDLEAIVARALRKSASDRYSSVEALREDLDRYRAGRPVQARAGSRAYRLGRYLRQYRWPLTVSVLLIAALSALNLRLAADKARISEARAQAESESRAAQAMVQYVASLFGSVAPSQARGERLEPRRLLDGGLEQLEQMRASGQRAPPSLFLAISQLYEELGLPLDALAAAQAGLQELGNAEDLALRAQLGIAHHGARNHPQAIAELGDVLAVPASRWADPLQRIRAQAALAMSHLQLGDVEPAAHALQAALAALPEATPAHWRARLLQPLAVVRILGGEVEEALALERQALDAYRTAHGELHPRTVNSLASMATLAYYGRRNREALDWGEQALAQARRLFGDEAATTLSIRTTLANILSALGQVRAAIEHQQAVLIQSADQPAAAQAAALINLADDLGQIGAYQAAQDRLGQAQDLLAGRPDPMETLRMALIHADLALQQHQPERALAHLNAAQAIDGSSVLSGGYRARAALMRAAAHRHLGQLTQGQAQLQQAQALIAESQSARSSLDARLAMEQGLHALAQGDAEEGRQQVEAAIAQIEQLRGPEAPQVLNFKVQWLDYLVRNGETAQARALASTLLPAARTQLAPQSATRQLIEHWAPSASAAQQKQ